MIRCDDSTFTIRLPVSVIRPLSPEYVNFRQGNSHKYHDMTTRSVHRHGWPQTWRFTEHHVNLTVILTDQIPVLRCTLWAFLAVGMRTRSAIQQAREVSAVRAVYWMSFQQHEIQWHLFFPHTVLPHLLRCGFQGTDLPKNGNSLTRASRFEE